MNQTPNLKKRFFYKFTRSAIGGFLSIVSLPLITRSLGAEQYGLFNYLKIFFEKIIQFFDIGTTAFYPKFSRRPKDKTILTFVILYDLILLVGTFIMLSLLFFSGKAESILSTKSLMITFSTLLFTWFLLIVQKITSFMDAIEKTIINEMLLLLMRIVLTLGIIILFIYNKLNISTYLHIQNFIILTFLIIFFALANKFFIKSKGSNSLKETAREFKDYSLPLFWASTVGILTGLLDRWLLQTFGGSSAQGYYSLGFNLGAICFLLTGSLTPLLLREYAISYEQKNKLRLTKLFSKYVPLFYVITSIIACFLVVHGDWLAPIIGGDEFRSAALPVMLMGMAPIHQTYGQLSGALMTATDRTKEYGGITMFVAVLGLPFTYLMLAPEEYLGLNLGATGLAIKMVTLQIIAVNIQIWFNTRYLEIKMKRFVIHQIMVVILFITIGFSAKALTVYLFQEGIMPLIISGFIYLIIIFSIILLFPMMISMDRNELLNHIKNPSAFLK